MNEPDSNRFKDDMVGRMLLGRYQIVRRLAAGGMGVVYLARAQGTAGFVKPVVVKLIHPHLAKDPQFSEMFIREAQILSHLQHPGIVNVVEFVEENGMMILVLEYVNGFQLREWIRYKKFRGEQLPTGLLIQTVLDMLEALHYAHTLSRPDGESMRIVHRDISPSNVLIDTMGRAKLLDFGIAFVSEGNSAFGTRSGSFKGKLSYAAPELFSGSKASIVSDVYSCGVVLHQLMVGRNEFARRSDSETLATVLNHVPSSVVGFRDDVPPEIDEIVGKALAKKPQQRYQSAGEFRNALSNAFGLDAVATRAKIADLASEDFGQEMADYIKMEALSSRDRAWREPSMMPPPCDAISADDFAPIAGQNAKPSDGGNYPLSSHPPGPTVVETPKKGPGNRTPTVDVSVEQLILAGGDKAGSRMPLVIGSAALIALAAVGAALFMGLGKSTDTPKIVVIQSPVDDDRNEPVASERGRQDTGQGIGQDAPDAAVPTGSVAAEADHEEPAQVEASPRPRTTAKKRPVSKTAALSTAFRKRKGSVSACFKKHGIQSGQQPKISINFEIDKTGKVRTASVSPAGVSGSPLGSCLRSVAERTRFPAQEEAVAFHIPVTASRVPK